MSVSINIENVIKKYDRTIIIPNLSLKIENGELFTLLGPSGCGKTTLLRMIAGFTSIEGGVIKFDDKVINHIPAHKRNIGMVFQNYAIFPHMTVKQNIEYGLKLRKIPKDEMSRKVDEILKLVKMESFKDRLPERLSGGQQQRVALARAIVIHPSVLLMDEPLSNLDAKLRIEMRSAIRDIQKEIGITTVYVTHDQEEALAISDRIAVIKDGIIQQVGKPKDIYTRPSNVFVSTFVGSSNLLWGIVKIDNGIKRLLFDDGFSIQMNKLSDEVKDNQRVIVSIRPEEFSVKDSGIKVKIKTSTFFGRYINYQIIPIESKIVNNQHYLEFTQDLGHVHEFFNEGDVIYLFPNPEKINVFTEDGEKNLIRDVKKNG
ncbi:MAG TPA: ABC transporter ATP-binding protein [Clostridia bacterium]|nr:ABC transporter ATP-binding protein [Clostridia bacterium]